MAVANALRTALYDSHVACGGRIVEFAGYDLPVQYTGVIAESKAVRKGAGMFDVSHMARLDLSGDRVVEFLEQVTTNDVSKLTDGRGQYSMLPNKDGGIVDDIIVYRLGQTTFKMVVNAANHAKDVAHLSQENTFGVEIRDLTSETVMVAVQGPTAVETLAGICSDPEGVRSAGMFGVVEATFGGVACFAARSGYTGEDGYELVCPAGDGPRLWQALLDAGVVPCGLGSRDVLRVEAGLPLYGHELGDELSPIAAGLGWVIGKEKRFLGSDEINRARGEGTPQKLQGIKMASRRLPGPGMKVYVDGTEVGTVTSGVYSPLLECGIGFAFIDSAVKLDTPCEVDVRGSREAAAVVNKRFFKRG